MPTTSLLKLLLELVDLILQIDSGGLLHGVDKLESFASDFIG